MKRMWQDILAAICPFIFGAQLVLLYLSPSTRSGCIELVTTNWARRWTAGHRYVTLLCSARTCITPTTISMVANVTVSGSPSKARRTYMLSAEYYLRHCWFDDDRIFKLITYPANAHNIAFAFVRRPTRNYRWPEDFTFMLAPSGWWKREVYVMVETLPQ